MKMSTLQVSIPEEDITAFCQRWSITELALFGSILREDFNNQSDVDLLVTFAPEARTTFFDMVHMQDELKEIFGRDVDLVSRRGIEECRNYIRRRAILHSAEVVYDA